MASNDVIVRLRMLGAAAFTGAAHAASTSVRGIGDAADSTSAKGGKLGGFMNKASGGLMAVGSMAATAGTALLGAGAAAGAMGIKFNAGMEQSKVAFTNLLGSGKEANAMLDQLYVLASKTPFEFPELTQATQKLLGFGMAAEDVIPTMTTVGDAVAGVGGGAAEIESVTRALGQIQAKGKVSSEELLQLAEAGVPAFKLLADQMGLTGAQLDKKLRAGAVSADEGLDALITGMDKKYGGMAKAQSKTFNGMLSSMKDSVVQQLGKITEPLFKLLTEEVFPVLNKALSGGGLTKFATTITPFLTKAFQTIKGVVLQLFDAFKPMAPFLQNILFPILKGLAIGVIGSVVAAFKVLVPIIKIIATVLGWVGEKAKPLAPWFERIGIVAGFVAGGPILKLIGGVGKLGGAFKVIAFVAKAAAAPIIALGKVFGVVFKAAGKLWGVLGKLGPAASKGAQALLAPFLDLGKKMVEVGRSIINGIVSGMRSMPDAIIQAIASMLPGGAVGRKLAGVLGLPGAAKGGIISSSGMAIVGERGPELVSVQRGARIDPLPSPALAPIPGLNASFGTGGGTVVVPVYLDGRVITEVVANRTADRMARR